MRFQNEKGGIRPLGRLIRDMKLIKTINTLFLA
jgi:hypothetical protein